MKQQEVQAKIGKSGTPVTVKYNLGENLEELVEQYSEDVIFNHARSSVIVALQGFMRSRIDPEREGGPLNAEDLQKAVDDWEPGIRKPGKTAAERVKEQFSKMDPELRKTLLAELAKGGGSAITDEGGGEEDEQEEGVATPTQQAAAGARGRKTAAR